MSLPSCSPQKQTFASQKNKAVISSEPTVFTGLENQGLCWVMRAQKQKCGAACGLSTSLKERGSGHADVNSLLLAARTLI